MSLGIDIQFVRETYQKMSDQDLIRVLTQDAVGLTAEAQEVVKEEIKKRNLDPNIAKGVLAIGRKNYLFAVRHECCQFKDSNALLKMRV